MVHAELAVAGGQPTEEERYVRELTRLDGLLEGVEVERRRLKWYPLIGLVLCPLGFFHARWLVLAIFGSGLATYACAFYLTYVHREEYRFLRGRVTSRLDDLRRTKEKSALP